MIFTPLILWETQQRSKKLFGRQEIFIPIFHAVFIFTPSEISVANESWSQTELIKSPLYPAVFCQRLYNKPLYEAHNNRNLRYASEFYLASAEHTLSFAIANWRVRTQRSGIILSKLACSKFYSSGRTKLA